MSEFTVGTLFLSRDCSSVEHALKATGLPHIVRALTPRWSVFLTPDEWLFLPETQAAVRHISEEAPLLHFSHAEDHGWSFRLFHGGRERAAFSEHYPWDPHHDLLVGEDDPHDAPAAPGADQLVYFRLLDLEPAAVESLGALLAGPSELDRPPAGRADCFRRLLGISEMEWISYRYAASEGTTG